MDGRDAMTEQDAVRAYKDVIAELDAAAAALREREGRQVVALERRLEELVAVAADAERAAAVARLASELAWDRVVDELWHEAWMTLRGHPQPAADADPDALDALVVAVERAAEAVTETRRRRTFGLGPR